MRLLHGHIVGTVNITGNTMQLATDAEIEALWRGQVGIRAFVICLGAQACETDHKYFVSCRQQSLRVDLECTVCGAFTIDAFAQRIISVV